jgi:hypothetical protein
MTTLVVVTYNRIIERVISKVAAGAKLRVKRSFTTFSYVVGFEVYATTL